MSDIDNHYMFCSFALYYPQVQRLRELLDAAELTSFGPIPLLLDPETKIKGIVAGRLP